MRQRRDLPGTYNLQGDRFVNIPSKKMRRIKKGLETCSDRKKKHREYEG